MFTARSLAALALLAAGCSGGTIISSIVPGGRASASLSKPLEDRMSAMGRLAHDRAQKLQMIARGIVFDNKGCGNTPDCGDDESANNFPGGQAETSIAVDASGLHIVIGYNDTRGFLTSPISVSGVTYSDDGGLTFVDGGQLPTVTTDVIGGQAFPQVFGDASVKYLGACTFVYSSILMKKLGADPMGTATVQTMGLHRSTDCGHTWQGPFEITAATNPSGQLAGGAPTDAADKELLDVDPDTGRVMVSWSNFTPSAPGGVEIRTAFSDNAGSGTPTWSAGVAVGATALEGQASIPAFAGNGSPNAYAAWRRFPSGVTNNVGFARSTDNGATWSAPISLTADFFTMDQVLGNDRNNTSPSVAVDNSRGASSGNVYVVYADNDGNDGSDIAFQRSTDGGQTFSAAVLLSSRPGADRAQWFPWVSVDNSIGRVYVFYYDQGIATSGDLTQTTYTFSDDGGAHWQQPRPMTDRPFQAAWGNDTGQPNIGDYIQGAAVGGNLYAAYAATHPVAYTDGEPSSTSFTVPDIEFKRIDGPARAGASASVQLGGDVRVQDSGGNGRIDPGETISLSVPLTNYITNPLNAAALVAFVAGVETSTPGVRAMTATASYPSILPGATQVNRAPIVLAIAPDFVPGTPIEVALRAHPGGNKLATIKFTLDTGTPSPTQIFAENFDGVTAGSLPPGWVSAHGGGANVVPWTTSSSFCGAQSNGAFHVNAEDGAGGPPTRFERLFSPKIVVPADAEYVTLEFDVCYDTEDDPSFNIQAYDGLVLRITDFTAGRKLRSVLVDAFASKFTTGDAQGYPKHFPRSSDSAYFQDMSAWAGDSGGVKHVKLKLPGMAGSTVQLRWEYTQDGGGICSDVRPGHSCGVLVDNIVMNSVKSIVPTP